MPTRPPAPEILSPELLCRLQELGYVVMPTEPTEAMLGAAGDAFMGAIAEHAPGNLGATDRPFIAWYRAMVESGHV